MVQRRLIAVALVVCLGRIGSAWAQDAGAAVAHTPPDVTTTVDAQTVVLGKRFTLRVAVTHPQTTSVDLGNNLVFGTAFEEVARVARTSPQTEGRVRTEFVLDLMPFELGKKAIPALPVTYVQGGRVSEMKTSPLQVIVTSTATGPAVETGLRSIAPPVSVMREDLTLMYVLGGLFGLLVIAYLFVKIRRTLERLRKRGVPGEDPEVAAPLPEDEEALSLLDDLEASGALDADDLKPAYHTMSEILRVYLGRRYAFPAIDSTTEEIRQHIGMAAGGAWIIAAAVIRWLENADLVKFANAPALPEDARKACDGVRDIVAQTRRSVQVVVPEPDPVPVPDTVSDAGSNEGKDG